MRNLAQMNTEDFTVNENGEAFISQTKVAELCGVVPHAISQQVVKTRDTLKLNEINQLHYESLELMIGYYAFDSQRTNDIACSNYRILAKAGAKAYIYNQAGYVMEAKKPKTKIEILNELVAELNLEHSERLKAEAKLLLIGNHLAGSIIGELGNDLPMNLTAKILATNLKIDLGQNMLMRLMRKHGWLMTGKRSIKEKNLPMQAKIKYMRVFLHRDPLTGITNHSTVLTQEGIVELCKVVLNWYTEI